MRRRIGLPTLCLALLALGITAGCASAATGTSGRECAQTEKMTVGPGGSAPSPSESQPCWEEIQPYPFGADGHPVGEEHSPLPECRPGASEPQKCYLTVTSMAFRAWNRGVAATTLVAPGVSRFSPTTNGVWVFDGVHWEPNHSFPGNKECPGNTVVWAGKLDYWLVGPGPSPGWSALCRYDGFKTHSWQVLKLPEATKSHVTPPATSALPNPSPREGGITSAACFAWNNCWFVGTYGVVVHWNGEALEDASPPSSEAWLQGEYTAAVARQNLAGEPFGVAVGADREGRTPSSSEKLPPQPDGAQAPQMYGSGEGVFSPLLFEPPPGDPFGTDLVAADFDTSEQGWVAGNPAGMRLKEREGALPGEDPAPSYLPSPAPSPLEPVLASGASGDCKAPAPNFEYQRPGAPDPAGSFLWSSISVVPGSGEALAGGSMRQQDPKFGEPVIAQVGCGGTATLTRFRVPGSSQPADREGGATAVAANATNDAWAATSPGFFLPLGGSQEVAQPPRLYRLSNGKEPEAPAGNDEESRPLELVKEPPIYEEEKAPPVEVAAAPELSLTVTPIPPITLPPAIYDVKVKLHKVKRHRRIYLSLYLTFKVARPVTVGAEALRHGRVVSRARARYFAGRTGELILSVERKRWPTNISFVS